MQINHLVKLQDIFKISTSPLIDNIFVIHIYTVSCVESRSMNHFSCCCCLYILRAGPGRLEQSCLSLRVKSLDRTNHQALSRDSKLSWQRAHSRDIAWVSWSDVIVVLCTTCPLRRTLHLPKMFSHLLYNVLLLIGFKCTQVKRPWCSSSKAGGPTSQPRRAAATRWSSPESRTGWRSLFECERQPRKRPAGNQVPKCHDVRLFVCSITLALQSHFHSSFLLPVYK